MRGQVRTGICQDVTRVSEGMNVVMCASIHFSIHSFTQQGKGGATTFLELCARLTVNHTDTAPIHDLMGSSRPSGHGLVNAMVGGVACYGSREEER